MQTDATPDWERTPREKTQALITTTAEPEEIWLADERSYRQVRQAVHLYTDPHWATQSHPSKQAAVAYLDDHYPQLRACPLSLDDLVRVVQHFPS